jgi:iron complex outermembrane receptor protein
MKHRTIALAISVALGATLAAAVRAQAVQAGDAAGPTVLDEVTVTARKREEALQDIPLVVNAFTAEQIERSNIQGLADISLRTPGLNYEGYVSAGLSGGLVLRGLTNTQLTNRTQNVAVFYDGVYLPNQAMFDLGLADIERVEVLKARSMVATPSPAPSTTSRKNPPPSGVPTPRSPSAATSARITARSSVAR